MIAAVTLTAVAIVIAAAILASRLPCCEHKSTPSPDRDVPLVEGEAQRLSRLRKLTIHAMAVHGAEDPRYHDIRARLAEAERQAFTGTDVNPFADETGSPESAKRLGLLALSLRIVYQPARILISFGQVTSHS
jgi:hypothetical protein